MTALSSESGLGSLASITAQAGKGVWKAQLRKSLGCEMSRAAAQGWAVLRSGRWTRTFPKLLSLLPTYGAYLFFFFFKPTEKDALNLCPWGVAASSPGGWQCVCPLTGAREGNGFDACRSRGGEGLQGPEWAPRSPVAGAGACCVLRVDGEAGAEAALGSLTPGRIYGDSD